MLKSLPSLKRLQLFHSLQRPRFYSVASVAASDLQPEEIRTKLGEWIVGQDEAKKSVAVAMRNRWRRKNVPLELRKEIIPKNILMVGPTGSGKTEIARRMADLSGAPFIKVEATKFTEVGYKGADVDSIIKDLLSNAIKLITKREEQINASAIQAKTEETLLNLLLGPEIDQNSSQIRDDIRQCLRGSLLENMEVPYEVKFREPPAPKSKPQPDARAMQMNISDVLAYFQAIQNPNKRKQKLKISEVRQHEEAFQKNEMVNPQKIISAAIHETQEYGIVFIDEIDKIASSGNRRHSDASDEGVQRDLLPLIEGCKIATDHGDIDTSKILFIAAGAFHATKPSDLLPELQGRLPIRVVLTELTVDDLYRIMTEPTAHIIRQQKALLRAEGVDLRVTDEAIRELAKLATEVNKSVENIGARRLHAVTETLFEDISFNAQQYSGKTIVFDQDDVLAILDRINTKSPNLKQYIL